MSIKNTPELWDSLWKPTSLEEDIFNLKREEASLRWKKLEKEVMHHFCSFKGLKVIELGSGGGTNALLFALRGSEVYVLDYSKKALERSKQFFDRNNAKVKLILNDALNLDKKLMGKFDVSMSFGLAEHFRGKDRINIIKSHFDVLNNKGITFISVPNKLNPPYRLHKLIMETVKVWKVGEEYPFSVTEFKKILSKIGKKGKFFGDSFIHSLNFINPIKLIKKKDFKARIKSQKTSPLDDALSYSLVLVGRNS